MGLLKYTLRRVLFLGIAWLLMEGTLAQTTIPPQISVEPLLSKADRIMLSDYEKQHKFETVMAFVLAAEGGYVNDPKDPGGETNFGISRRTYPKEDILHLTKERAVELYRRDFWTPLGCEDMTPEMALLVMDTGVNMGLGTTLKMLAWAKRNSDMPGTLTVEEEFLCARSRRYLNLCHTNSDLRKFKVGWLRRNLRLLERIS